MGNYIETKHLTNKEGEVLNLIAYITKLDLWFELISIGGGYYVVYDKELQAIVELPEAIILIDEGVDHETLERTIKPEEYAIFTNLVERMHEEL